MQVQQFLVRPDKTEATILFGSALERADLVLVFGSRDYISSTEFQSSMREFFSQAVVAGCAVTREHAMGTVWEDVAVVTAVQFSSTRVKSASISLTENPDRGQAGRALREGFPTRDLNHVYLFCDERQDGMQEFLEGFNAAGSLSVSGVLVGDESRDGSGLILDNQGADSNLVLAVGLYGTEASVSWDVAAGWDGPGTEHEATRAEGDLLYELDGLPALDVYEDLLGEEADSLPASGVFHPFQFKGTGQLRVPVEVDRTFRTLRFRGSAPTGPLRRMLLTDPETLIAASATIARQYQRSREEAPVLALVGSDEARRQSLGPLWDSEVAEITNAFGAGVCSVGLYSSGAFSIMDGDIRFHEQASWIATISEK